MFGKGKRKPSDNDRFVMARGRQAGNLKSPKGQSGHGRQKKPSKGY